VNEQGKEVMNFQITVTIAILICVPLMFICIGYFLLLGVVIAELVFTIIGAVTAAGGTPYRYPMTFRFIT
jgi:uncharacterized Tic20 family protein